MKTKLFTLLLAVAASVGTVSAENIEHVKIGDLYYKLYAEKKTARVAKYNCVTGDIVIPASVTYNSVSYSVTFIGEAFYGCSSLTSVTIPNSVTTYNYSIASKDNKGNTLNTESGSFKTTGESTGLQNVTDQLYETKFFRNGQLYILRDGKTYSVTGQEVK